MKIYGKVKCVPLALAIVAGATVCTSRVSAGDTSNIDQELRGVLQRAQFTGRIESTLEQRLGRRLDRKLAETGRRLWFDVITGLHDDNTCGGCHAPGNGMGDSQSMAIGIQNNNIVGRDRNGPRNQRRTPSAINVAFYPKLMWNGRISAPSGDPFDNSLGFAFPLPEGVTQFPPNDPFCNHLLIAQAHIPPTEMTEAAGYTGTRGTIGPEFDAFDDGKGSGVPAPDASTYRNEPIREAVLARLNANPAYRKHFGDLFPSVADGAPIDYMMVGRAIAEFEFTLTFANAPLDRFARGDSNSMTQSQKKGALLFFGKAGCVSCHAVAGQSNEMFSDFQMHVAGTPQIAPFFGWAKGNVIFDGDGADEDFGLEQFTGDSADRYKFRTSPLRNLAVQRAFFHNGAFTNLRDAVRFHLDAPRLARSYNATTAGVDPDLQARLGPIEPVLARLDPLLSTPPPLTQKEFDSLVDFLQYGLLDPRAEPDNLCKLIPKSALSDMKSLQSEVCPAQ